MGTRELHRRGQPPQMGSVFGRFRFAAATSTANPEERGVAADAGGPAYNPNGTIRTFFKLTSPTYLVSSTRR